MPLFLLAAALPLVYWDQPPATIGQLRKAGVECIAVPSAQLGAWKSAGFCAEAADPAARRKMLDPRVDYKTRIASATSAPWVIANGWRILREPGQPVYYEPSAGKAALALAEAYVYQASAFVRVPPEELEAAASMLRFLKQANMLPLDTLANIGVVDDGKLMTGEVMNLLARRNLLYRVVKQADPKLDLNVTVGSAEFPAEAARNPGEFATLVRQKLTDEKRLLRIYGSETVVARLTGDGKRVRLYLLNYAARPVQELRVRVKGDWDAIRLLAPGGNQTPADIARERGATEFTVPTIAVLVIAGLE